MTSLPYLFFILLGFLSGSVMYSQLLPELFGHVNIVDASDDKNPGSANVFKSLGPFWGIPCLLCDMLKGTVPVAICLHFLSWEDPLFGLVIAAPVLGHAKKGKAIAVSFGVLIGLLPLCAMVFYLVLPFLFFSALVRINPHSWRAVFSFLCFAAAAVFRIMVPSLQLGGLLVAAIVMLRHLVFCRCYAEKLHISIGWSMSFRKKKNYPPK